MVIVLFHFCENASAKYPIKPMPSDTVLKFVSHYGKDSLLRLLDYGIDRAARFFKENNYEIFDPLTTAQFIAVNDCYGLEIDLTEKENSLQNGFFKMYGKEYGKTDSFRVQIRKMRDSIPDFSKLFFRNIRDKMSKVGFAVLCDEIPYLPKMADSAYSVALKSNTREKLLFYYMFAELQRNCPDYASRSEIAKAGLFKKLNEKVSFSHVINSCNKTGIKDPTEKSDIYNAYLLAAYGLYGNAITVEKNAECIFYILTLQKELHGDWPSFYTSNLSVHDDFSTFYALWSLVQFREKLINWQLAGFIR